MTDFSTMTKKELLALDAAKMIKGRHEMTKEQLVAELEGYMAYLEETAAAEEQIVAHQMAGEIENSTSYSDEEAADLIAELPIRPAVVEEEPKQKKVWVNKSGNVPYKRKHYFLDMETYNTADEQLAKAPNQVRLILKCMAEAGITDYDSAMIGREIVDLAKNDGYLTTTIPSANLFAYYRRELEKFGVTHAG